MKEDLTPRLEQRILDRHAVLEISGAEFATLANARKTLVDALAFEQKFELLLGNYLDFETGATRLSLTSLLGVDYTTYLSGATFLLEANRLLMNLLTAARAYLDQVKQDFKHLPLTPAFGEHAKTLCSAEYDDSAEYRFMEALRNHSQHKGMPVHGYTAGEGLHEALTFTCVQEQLSEAGDFKSKVLAEMPAKVDLRIYARQYVECLSNVHKQLRELVTASINEARQNVEDAIGRYKGVNDGRALGLHAHRVVGGKEEWVGLMVEWDDVRLHLTRKNDDKLRLSRKAQGRTAAR